ncbi:GtrA family protein [bacterium AH-315-K03]|nr:GtrA family protein [bacterium AH-315-K03]
MKLAIVYTVLSVMSCVANIAGQYIFLIYYVGSHAINLSILIGTFIGLVMKYVLDKNYIFKYYIKNTLQNIKTFFLYTLMGVMTTGVFWGFELGFHRFFESESLRYLGGAIGLLIGYLIKYQLDKRYVFVNAVIT